MQSYEYVIPYVVESMEIETKELAVDDEQRISYAAEFESWLFPWIGPIELQIADKSRESLWIIVRLSRFRIIEAICVSVVGDVASTTRFGNPFEFIEIMFTKLVEEEGKVDNWVLARSLIVTNFKI